MYKLDRTAFKKQSHEQASDNYEYWLAKTLTERLAASAYLNSIAYNYPLNEPPRMDKTCFKTFHRA